MTRRVSGYIDQTFSVSFNNLEYPKEMSDEAIEEDIFEKWRNGELGEGDSMDPTIEITDSNTLEEDKI